MTETHGSHLSSVWASIVIHQRLVKKSGQTGYRKGQIARSRSENYKSKTESVKLSNRHAGAHFVKATLWWVLPHGLPLPSLCILSLYSFAPFSSLSQILIKWTLLTMGHNLGPIVFFFCFFWKMKYVDDALHIKSIKKSMTVGGGHYRLYEINLYSPWVLLQDWLVHCTLTLSVNLNRELIPEISLTTLSSAPSSLSISV